MALWLEVVRILLGILILFAISSLYGIFKRTKIIQELHLLSAAFLIFTVRGALHIYTYYSGLEPMLLRHLPLDDFLTALMYLIFAYAILRLQKIINIIRVENRLIKAVHELLG